MNRDLYVSKRDSKDAPWGQPVPLTMLNTTKWESCPALSLDEHLLYFSSDRPGGYGQWDLWVSRRHDRRDDFGWEPPVNIGSEINKNGSAQITPTFFEDESGKVWIYFARGVMNGITHIYQSELMEDGTFGPATPVTELNSAKSEAGPTVRRDGLEIIFLSTRAQGLSQLYGLYDFYRSTRVSTADPWSEPELVESLFPSFAQGRIALSFDGTELYFTTYWNTPTPPNPDLWVAVRSKLKGNSKK